MKNFLALVILLLVIFRPDNAFAQGMAGSNGYTSREEAEGKEVWDKLQSKQLECKNLTDNEYQALGEYFMGRMMGSSHESMNNMMIQMMGEEGEKQMHIAMGKRLSSCDPNAQVPSGGIGFMPMMWMMRGGGNPMMGQGSGMMNGWGNVIGGSSSFGVLGWFSMLLFWVLLILVPLLGVIALVRYLMRLGQSKDGRTPIGILKERYARGEIDKKEFEERKKDLI